MTYFHTRDFDPSQPMIDSLPIMRKFKSYVGLSTSFAKFQKLLNDFDFVSVKGANELTDWETTRVIELWNIQTRNEYTLLSWIKITEKVNK